MRSFDSAVSPPAEPVERKALTLEGVDHRAVPVEDVRVQPAAARHNGIQEIAKLVRKPAWGATGSQPYAAVNIPGGDEDRSLRPFHRAREGAEVGLAVHQKRHTARASAPPAIASLNKDGFGLP